jgi:hypothetical protein
MSLLQTAFIEKSRVPDKAQLEAAVRALGFDLAIDDFYRPFDCSGYLPCILNGKESGFEIYFDSPDEILQAFPHLKNEIGSRNCAITFRWGGNMAECTCVLMVSAALAKSFGAVVHYQEDDRLYSYEQLIEEAKSALQDEQSSPPPRPETPPKKPWWRLW